MYSIQDSSFKQARFTTAIMRCVLKILALLSVAPSVFNYLVSRSPCRRYAIFKVTDRDNKVTGGLISSQYASTLSACLKGCLDVANCQTFNFKEAITPAENNCELLSTTRSSGLTAVTGWKHYEPVSQSVSIVRILKVNRQMSVP